MQFLKALFWLIVGFVVAMFMYANRDEVVLVRLWANLLAEVKLPALLIIVFLLGFLPTFVIYRTRVWSLRRRLDNQLHAHVANAPVPVRPAAVRPVPPSRPAGDGVVPGA